MSPVRWPASSTALATAASTAGGFGFQAERSAAAPSRPSGSRPEGWPCPGRRCPARSHERARTGSPCRRCVADGSMPSDPEITPHSSERMSPNRFSVSTTSKSRGTIHQVHGHRVDQLVLDGDAGVRRPASLVDGGAPELRALEHVGLVHLRQLARGACRRARMRFPATRSTSGLASSASC